MKSHHYTAAPFYQKAVAVLTPAICNYILYSAFYWYSAHAQCHIRYLYHQHVHHLTQLHFGCRNQNVGVRSVQPDVITTSATVWSSRSDSWLPSYPKTDDTIVHLSQIQTIFILFSPLLSLYSVTSAGVTSESLKSRVSLSDTMTELSIYLRTRQMFFVNFAGAQGLNC